MYVPRLTAPQRQVPFVVRAWRAARVLVHLVQGLATTIGVFPFAQPASRNRLIRAWSRKLLSLLNVETRVGGRLDAHRGNVLFVANHVSWLDIVVIDAERPARFVAKAELASWPVVGRLIRNVGTIFVARERRRDTRRVNHHATEALRQGDVVAVFPEGTTGDGTSLLRFHASLLQPVVDSGGYVQPLALRYRDADGAPSTVAFYGDETFVQSFWRLCGERKLVVELAACEPIAARHAHRRDLARDAEDAIRRALGLPRAMAPGTPRDRAA